MQSLQQAWHAIIDFLFHLQLHLVLEDPVLTGTRLDQTALGLQIPRTTTDQDSGPVFGIGIHIAKSGFTDVHWLKKLPQCLHIFQRSVYCTSIA